MEILSLLKSYYIDRTCTEAVRVFVVGTLHQYSHIRREAETGARMGTVGHFMGVVYLLTELRDLASMGEQSSA